MKSALSTTVVALCLVTAGSFGVAQSARSQVAVDISGSHGTSEGACTQLNKLDGTFDCTYGGTNATGTAGGWSGPSLGGVYYAAGSAGDSISYAPVAGDAKISPAISGQLTVNGTGATATVGGTIVVGPAVRNIATSSTTRAVQRWTSITHTLASTTVSSAVANGAGGFDYIVGSLGAPADICLAPGGACFGLHESGADPTTGPVNSWGVGGVAGTKPAVGITRLENFAGVTATGTTDLTNIGATTTAVIADPTCESTDVAAPLDCDDSPLLWGVGEDAGFDNLILAFSTNAAGDITSGRAYWTQDYRIDQGGGTGDNSDASGTFTFTGNAGPGCAEFAVEVLENSVDNAIAAPAQCTMFGAPVTITIVTPPTNGTAIVSGANNIIYTPGADFDGTDTLTYNGNDGTDNDDGVLTITVAADSAPVAPDGAITISTQGVDPGTVTGTLDVATLATYEDGNPPTSIVISQPTNGTATITGTTVTYAPNANVFAGTDTFTYTLTDNDGDVAQGTVTVTATNVTPTVADGAITTDQDDASDPLALTITAGNGTPAQHTLSVTTDGTNGTCTLTAADATGQVIYTPDADFFGADSCVVTLTDGNGDSDTATITVTVEEHLGTIIVDGGSSAIDPASLAALGGLLPFLRRRRRAAAKSMAMAAAAGVLASPAAMAGEGNWDWDYDGIYLGAGVIGTSIESGSDFNTALLAEADLTGFDSSGSFEDFPYGGQLYVGWMFNNMWGLEGRWSDSGDAESDILFQAPDDTVTHIGNLEGSIDGWTLYAVGNWHLADRWDFFGKLGYTDQDGDLDIALNDGVDTFSGSVSDSDSGFAAALGLRWRFARHWAATVEGEYLDVSFQADGAEGGSFDVIDEPWRVGLNVEYWFGGHETAAAVAPMAAVVAAPPPPPPAPAPRAPSDADGDGIVDGTDQCPDTPKGDRVGAQGCSCDVTRMLTFRFNSAELTDGDKVILDEMAETLTRLHFVSGVIEGHTDSTGPDAFNQQLSERRAAAVADALAARGISRDRMQIVGKGESEPAADNTTKEGRAQNRRVVAKRTDCDK